jgi:hypothetical protein
MHYTFSFILFLEGFIYPFLNLVFFLHYFLHSAFNFLLLLEATLVSTAVPSFVYMFGGELPLQMLQLADHVWLGLSVG